MIGKFMLEALSEGAFLGILKNAWGWAIKLFGMLGLDEKFGKEVKSYLVDPKGWDDENLFAEALSKVRASISQKKNIVDAMYFLEEWDGKNNTKYARNFRIIVSLADKEPVAKGGIKPGVSILQEIAINCKSPYEVVARIIAVGAMQDSSTTAEKFLKFGQEKIWPKVEELFKDNEGNMKIRNSIQEATKKINSATEERKKKLENRPWWVKLLNP